MPVTTYIQVLSVNIYVFFQSFQPTFVICLLEIHIKELYFSLFSGNLKAVCCES